MDTTFFTPGPWREGKTCGAVVADTSKNITVGGAYGDDAEKYYGGCLIGESIAPGNVALIKLAPEMFDLLHRISEAKEPWSTEEIKSLLDKSKHNNWMNLTP